MKKHKFVNIYLVIFVLTLVGIIRITSTYHIFWQTWDEPAHIASGMEWLSEGKYAYEHLHPPLGRVMDALGLFFEGIRSTGAEEKYVEGNALLHWNNDYEKNLTLARLGVLPFFAITTIVVWKWSKLYFGILPALFSVFFLTTLPPILAHSGLATTDMAFTAMFMVALFSFCLWLETPNKLNTFFLGLTLGLCFLSKFSALIFLPLSLGLIAILYFFRAKKLGDNYIFEFKKWATNLVIALAISFLTIWAGYQFSYSTILKADPIIHGRLRSIIGTDNQLTYKIARYVVDKVKLPAPEFFSGIFHAYGKDKGGHLNCLFGECRSLGWWYFFPLLFLVKTPIAFLIAIIIGFIVTIIYVKKNPQQIHLLAPAIVATGIMLISMRSNINIGLRHILVIYPLLTIVAGYGISKLWQFRKKSYPLGAIIVTLLLTWQIVASFSAHPDYLANFNMLAGKHPERNFNDSDIDWGQDLKRLAITLKNHQVEELAICYNGSAELDKFGLPEKRNSLNAYEKTTGWIAMSVQCIHRGTYEAPYDQYRWLYDYQPVELVGKSIYLYYIKPD